MARLSYRVLLQVVTNAGNYWDSLSLSLSLLTHNVHLTHFLPSTDLTHQLN